MTWNPFLKWFLIYFNWASIFCYIHILLFTNIDFSGFYSIAILVIDNEFFWMIHSIMRDQMFTRAFIASSCPNLLSGFISLKSLYLWLELSYKYFFWSAVNLSVKPNTQNLRIIKGYFSFFPITLHLYYYIFSTYLLLPIMSFQSFMTRS